MQQPVAGDSHWLAPELERGIIGLVMLFAGRGEGPL